MTSSARRMSVSLYVFLHTGHTGSVAVLVPAIHFEQNLQQARMNIHNCALRDYSVNYVVTQGGTSIFVPAMQTLLVSTETRYMHVRLCDDKIYGYIFFMN